MHLLKEEQPKFYKLCYLIKFMDGEEKEVGWKPRFLSEYSMGELDFLRYNEHLKMIETMSGIINSTDIPTLEQCQNYFAELNVLYKLWKPIISSAEKIKKLDDNLIKAKKIKRMWENSNRVGIPLGNNIKLSMVDILDEFHTDLMEMKQIIGLGIKVQKNMTTKEKIKAGMRPGKIRYALPEP